MDQLLVPSIPLRRFVDENWCVVEEAKDGPDPKLKIIDRPVEEGEEERNGSCNEEKNGASGYTVDEDDSEDDMKGWDDNGDPYLPFRYRLAVSCPEGQHYTVQEAEEIFDSACKRNDDLVSEWCDIVNSKTTPRPVFPLPVFPSVTPYCVSGYKCYHVRYLTGNTSETAPEHPYFMPCEMMQVFSVGLSSHLTHPIDIYGWFSVRDDWEPLRNYLFKRSRDDPAMISKGCSFLPLRSPCRGIYVSQYFLMDVELWIKDDGERSADKLLFRGYVEVDTSSSGFDSVLRGRFQGECHGLVMQYGLLCYGIETVIEVKAEAKQPSDVRISALTSGFDKEISLYNGKFCGSGLMFKHVMAVNKQEELHVVLKVDDSSYKWTFKAGIGVVVAPEHPISGFAQYFVMNVSSRRRGKAASASQWSCICNDVHISETHL